MSSYDLSMFPCLSNNAVLGMKCNVHLVVIRLGDMSVLVAWSQSYNLNLSYHFAQPNNSPIINVHETEARKRNRKPVLVSWKSNAPMSILSLDLWKHELVKLVTCFLTQLDDKLGEICYSYGYCHLYIYLVRFKRRHSCAVVVYCYVSTTNEDTPPPLHSHCTYLEFKSRLITRKFDCFI